MSLRFLDVLHPFRMAADGIDAESEDLAAPLIELRLQPCHVAELGRADRREVLRVREEDGPAISDPLMEVDRPIGRLRREVRRFGVDPERHAFPPLAIVPRILARPRKIA